MLQFKLKLRFHFQVRIRLRKKTWKASNQIPSTAIGSNKHSFFDSLGSSDDNTLQKTGKKTPKRKVNPKSKESSKDTMLKASKAKKDVYTAKGFFFFTEKAKPRFQDNKPIILG